MNRDYVSATILDAKGATGAGNGQLVDGFQHILVAVATDGGADANLTVKFQGSIAATQPTWTTGPTVSNMWEYVGVWDINANTHTTGDTGFVVSGADDYKLYLVNTDGLRWFNARVTARSAGEVTVTMRAFSNT